MFLIVDLLKLQLGATDIFLIIALNTILYHSIM